MYRRAPDSLGNACPLLADAIRKVKLRLRREQALCCNGATLFLSAKDRNVDVARTSVEVCDLVSATFGTEKHAGFVGVKTLEEYQCILDLYIEPYCRNTMVKKLRAAFVNTWLTNLIEGGGRGLKRSHSEAQSMTSRFSMRPCRRRRTVLDGSISLSLPHVIESAERAAMDVLGGRLEEVKTHIDEGADENAMATLWQCLSRRQRKKPVLPGF
jgi:hypothetical protein